MALVDLPSSPGPASSTMVPIDFGGPIPGLLGGATERQNRLGNRWSVMVNMPPLGLDAARAWSADLTLGVQRGVRWKLRQVGLASGPIGAPLVAGGSQMGFALDVDGFIPGASWAKGAFVSLISGGRRYLHKLAAAGFADGSGAGTLNFTEALRVVPADNDVVDFAPSIEGLLTVEGGMTINEKRLGSPFGFTIEEQG